MSEEIRAQRGYACVPETLDECRGSTGNADCVPATEAGSPLACTAGASPAVGINHVVTAVFRQF